MESVKTNATNIGGGANKKLPFKRRTAVLVAVLVLWLLAALVMMFHIAFGEQGRYLKISEQLSRRDGVIQPLRGTIYDRNGQKLAWTEMYYDLYWGGSESANPPPPIPEDLLEKLRAVVPDIMPHAATEGTWGIPLKKAITPSQVAKIGKLLRSRKGLRIRHRVERLRINNEAVRKLLGELVNGHGISGVEKQYDRKLYGKDGSYYKIMLDRNGNFVLGEDATIVSPVRGDDVTLYETLEAMIAKGGGK